MKVKILLGCALATMMFTTSCNDALDMQPISQITPDGYYTSAEQLTAYLNNYYTSALIGPYGTYMYHEGGWNAGMNKSDTNTDIYVNGLSGNTTLFANDHWDTPSAKQLQSPYYTNVRAMNYLIGKINSNIANKSLDGTATDVKNAKGEAHFMRALFYFRILGDFGDAPIVKEVLDNNDESILPASERAPRNEVADFILADLDTAIANLQPRSAYSGQRLNQEAAQLFASRVALFEATFEKYHAGVKDGNNVARVSGDQTAHVQTLLNKVLTYAQPVADDAMDNLTPNYYDDNGNVVIEPVEGVTTGWNAYFEMFSQPSLASNKEVLLWKQYDADLGITHDVPYRSKVGCAGGFTRNFVQSFLMQDGTPIYVDGSGYKGDLSLTDVATGRDPRLRLFVWTDQLVEDRTYFEAPDVIGSNQEIRMITGYEPRKYYTYDPSQISDDALHGTNACPIFRSVEAMLNYMEASCELNNGGQPNETAMKYWGVIRSRAAMSNNIAYTVEKTNLEKEYDSGNGDFGVYSGSTMVSKWLYNVRRERLNEMFNEGLRRLDLVRWRSYDNMIANKWIPEGVNFWGGNIWSDVQESYGIDEKTGKYKQEIKADGSTDANVSSKDQSNYLRPYSRNMSETNELRYGLNWHEAYYLYPLGVADLTSASPERDVNSSKLYQNPFWSTTAGDHALK